MHTVLSQRQKSARAKDNLLGRDGRGNDQGGENLMSGEAGCGEFDPKAKQACNSTEHRYEQESLCHERVQVSVLIKIGQRRQR